ncbi:MAG: hypothetical protein K0U72_18035 [Gammaproteobacteria bacterium]|nr:hypothetical protein [Gammaproteobacteria bacterium]
MIVPDYWAEARERVVVDGKTRTYKRMGWSNDSDEDAHRKAKERLAEAIADAHRGENVRRVDRNVPYNGAEGLPIREEIISRRGDSVITRNAYGAACLNTPDVMFADVDVDEPSTLLYSWTAFGLFVAAAFLTRSNCDCDSEPYFVAIILAGIFLSGLFGSWIGRVVSFFGTDRFEAALAKIEAFAEKNRRWILRVYRTPNGYRVLAMHNTFDPVSGTAQDFMKSIGGDPLYALMCRNQNCFRARLSPKPWRIGVRQHMRPRPGVWPIAEERMSERRRWVRMYEKESAGFAACRYEKTFGSGIPSRKCEEVRRLHDDLCRADSDLPIA